MKPVWMRRAPMISESLIIRRSDTWRVVGLAFDFVSFADIEMMDVRDSIEPRLAFFEVDSESVGASAEVCFLRFLFASLLEIALG